VIAAWTVYQEVVVIRERRVKRVRPLTASQRYHQRANGAHAVNLASQVYLD